jgi:ABC-type Zn uptake system ZnuABC Zn-binding protein ZnuA
MLSFSLLRRPRAVSALGRTTVRGAAVAAVAAVLASAFGCARHAEDRRRVAATVFPVYDLARRVAADRLEVRLILQPGLDAHSYEPRPRDVAALAEADLIFAVGLGLDPWAHALARSAGAGEARVFEMGPLMDPILAPPGVIRTEPLIDPHFWTDPVRAQRAVSVIVDTLSALDAAGGPFYRERGEELKRSLQTVHGEITARTARWTRRRIVTFHGSLFYFAERYGLAVVGVVEPVPAQEPTAQHLASLIGLLKGPEGAVLFTEPQMDVQLARSLAREAGVDVYEVDPLGGGPQADSYEALVRQIARAMDEALQ